MQIVESARWWHTQRILFLNDPDHICARTNPEWARSLLSLVSLSGQPLMLSDPHESYDAQRVEMIRKALPPVTTYAGETGPLDVSYAAFAWCKEHGAAFKDGVRMDWDQVSDEESYVVAGEHETSRDDHPLGCLWAFHISTGAGTWCVAYRFAGTPLRASRVPLERLQLDPRTEYLAFDFWAQEYVGEVADELDVPALPLGHCQVIGLREKLARPQFLASSRHVSMDAVSVKSQQFDGRELILEIEGIPSTQEEYFFHCPEGWRLHLAQVKGAEGRIISAGGACVSLALNFTARLAEVHLCCTRA